MNHLRIIAVLALPVLLGLATPGRGQNTAQELLQQGRKLMESGQYLQAAQAYKQAIRLQPDLEPAHLALKEAYGGLSHPEKLREAHRLLRELPPDDAVGHYGLGILYVLKNDVGYAEDEYLILKKLNPALAQRLY